MFIYSILQSKAIAIAMHNYLQARYQRTLAYQVLVWAPKLNKILNHNNVKKATYVPACHFKKDATHREENFSRIMFYHVLSIKVLSPFTFNIDNHNLWRTNFSKRLMYLYQMRTQYNSSWILVPCVLGILYANAKLFSWK